MLVKNEERVEHLLNDVVEYARGRLPEPTFTVIEPFLRGYYELVDVEDIQSRDPADLYGAAMAHWQTAQKFVTGREVLRVYNPNLEQHGWHSDHTVVEIVNDDMPFLVDSVTMEVNRLGLALHSAIHPVFRVWRAQIGCDRAHRPRSLGRGPDPRPDSGGCAIGARILHTFRSGPLRRGGEARRVAREHRARARRRARGGDGLAEDHRHRARDHRRAEGAATRARTATKRARSSNGWSRITSRSSAIATTNSSRRTARLRLRGVPGSGAGILRETLRPPTGDDVTLLPPAAASIIEGATPIFLTKANSRATVHRPGYLDYVGVKRVGPDGKVTGERRFLGLYTSTAYLVPTSEIPIVRRKCANIVRRAGFLAKGHLHKSLISVLEQYPRDELFQADEDVLFDIALGVLRLQEHQRTRLFVRRDRFDRFVSCLVFVPRDKFNTDLRRRISKVLMEAFNGKSIEFTPLLSESPLARIHITVRAAKGAMPEVDTRELEARVVQVARRWQDDLADALIDSHGEEAGNRLLQRYADSFPAGYREDYPARTAVRDIELIEETQAAAGGLAMSLYRPIEAGRRAFRFKVYRVGEPIALSHSLPMLEHLGVRVDEERPYRIEPTGAPHAWIHDFGLELADDVEFDIDRVKALFENAFASVWTGEVENDDFNRLVLRAQLGARDVTIMRAYAKYLRQVGSTFSDAYIERALTGNPAIARKLLELFLVRFDPADATDGEVRDKRAERVLARNRSRARQGAESRRRPHPAAVPRRDQRDGAHQPFPPGQPTESRGRTCRSSSIRRRCRACPSRSRCSRSGSTRRGWKACICAADASRAAGCAGRTGARTSAPKCSA